MAVNRLKELGVERWGGHGAEKRIKKKKRSRRFKI